jgi:hypothetical protein
MIRIARCADGYVGSVKLFLDLLVSDIHQADREDEEELMD